MIRLLLLILLFCSFHHAVYSSGDTIVSLHGVGTESPCVQYVLDSLQEECEHPCRLTYRIPSKSKRAQNMMLVDKYAFGVDHIPLNVINHDNDKDPVFTFPIGMTAWGLYSNLIFDDDATGEINVGPNLNLTEALILEIIYGDVTQWNVPKLLDQNPALRKFSGIDDIRDEISVGLIIPNYQGPDVTTQMLINQPWSKFFRLEEGTQDATISKTKFLIGSTPQELRKLMVDQKGLAIGFLPYYEEKDDKFSNMLTEVPLTTTFGKTMFLSDAQKPLYQAVDVPDSPKDDFTDFSTYHQKGNNVWPLLVTEYLFVHLETFTNVLSEEQRGLLINLLGSFDSSPHHQEHCMRFGYIGVTSMEIPEFKNVIKNGLDDLKDAAPYQYWGLEEDDQLGNIGEFVTTPQRQSFQSVEISHLTNALMQMDAGDGESEGDYYLQYELTAKVEDLENLYSSLKNQFDNMKKDDRDRKLLLQSQEVQHKEIKERAINKVRRNLYDDVILNMNEQLPTFTDRDHMNIEAALVLASISFTLWMLYFVEKIWWFFSKP